MTIQEKATKIIELRDHINEQMAKIETLRIERDELQRDIIEHLDRLGFKSIKTDEAMISKQVAKTLMIVDEKILINDLKEKGLKDYFREQIDKELFRGLSREALKQNREFAGTEIRETTFLSIRKSR